MAELTLPIDEERIRELRVGANLELTGRMVTGRDAAHKWLLEDFRDEVAPYLEGASSITAVRSSGSMRTVRGNSWPQAPRLRYAKSLFRPR